MTKSDKSLCNSTLVPSFGRIFVRTNLFLKKIKFHLWGNFAEGEDWLLLLASLLAVCVAFVAIETTKLGDDLLFVDEVVEEEEEEGSDFLIELTESTD